MEKTPRVRRVRIAVPSESVIHSRSNSKHIALVVGGIIIVATLGLWGWYRMGIHGVNTLSESSISVAAASVFKTPVASINGEKILYTEYLDNLRAMRTFYDTDTTGLPRLTESEMSKYVLSRLLFNRLTSQIALEYRVTLEPSEIEGIINENIIAGFGSRVKAIEEIMNRHGWTLEQFVENIVKPAELEQKLSKAYLNSVYDPAKKEMLRQQAEAALQRIKNGESFETLLAEFGSENGGDLGWVRHGSINPEFENAVFSIETGGVVDHVLETERGFDIVRVDDKRVIKEEATGADIEEVKVSHILFQNIDADTTQFTTFMNQRLATSHIEVSKGLQNPFENVK
ncbi:MAG TPA: peptidylprolyl isomerase [Candidatus Magasanikbacteria bacterium]|nr:peptidylprolyl isomerase [Candidatus Magasanikbacteria bacterium]